MRGAEKEPIRYLGLLFMPSRLDIKVEVLSKDRVRVNYAERFPPTIDEASFKVLAEQTASVGASLFKATNLKLKVSPEKREMGFTMEGKPLRVFCGLFTEFLGCYLASGGDLSGALRGMMLIDGLHRGVLLVEKPLSELPRVEKVVVPPEDVMKGAISKMTTDNLRQMKRFVEEELRRREEEAPDE